jgi:hypothetical protein
MTIFYSPNKINVNPDFIKSNYLTACSNKNVKITIVEIYDGNRYRISKTRCIYIPGSFRERPIIHFYLRYHVVK